MGELEEFKDFWPVDSWKRHLYNYVCEESGSSSIDKKWQMTFFEYQQHLEETKRKEGGLRTDQSYSKKSLEDISTTTSNFISPFKSIDLSHNKPKESDEQIR